MTDRTTINVGKEAHREASKAKEEDETWSDYLLRSTDIESVEKTEPWAEIEVDADMIRDVVSDEIQKYMSEMTVNVDMDELDLSGSEITEEDVRNIVVSEIESTVHEQARQI